MLIRYWNAFSRQLPARALLSSAGALRQHADKAGDSSAPSTSSSSARAIDVTRYMPGPIRLTRKHKERDRRAEREQLMGKPELRDDENLDEDEGDDVNQTQRDTFIRRVGTIHLPQVRGAAAPTFPQRFPACRATSIGLPFPAGRG